MKWWLVLALSSSVGCGAGEILRRAAVEQTPPNTTSQACELECAAPEGSCISDGHCELTAGGPACAYTIRPDGLACELPGARAGVCEHGRCVACTNNSQCADQVDCTLDTCRAGACIHEDHCVPSCELACPAPAGGCLAPGHCELQQGAATCVYPADAPDGSRCAQPSGVAGVCDGGGCVGCRAALDCDDGDSCTSDACAGGTCSHTSICTPTCNLDCSAPSGCLTSGHCQLWADGPWCSYYGTLPNGSACTTVGGASGYCQDSVCVTCASAADCNDGDPCTTDTCNGGACAHSGSCPSCTVASCPPTTQGGCRINGRCGPSGCEHDHAANGTTCAVLSSPGTCNAGDCIALAPPVDLVTYLPPNEPTVPWCPMSGVGLPSVQILRPNPPVACEVIGAAQDAFGNCPITEYPLRNFELTDPPPYPGGRMLFDLRLLKFRGVKSLRFRMPANPTNVNFNLTSFSWGTDLYDYRVSISELPCEFEPPGTPFNASYCDGGTGHTMSAAVGYTPTFAPACSNLLRPGHIYYFNILGGGNPDDPGADGVIDAGDRLLITVEFIHP